MTTRQTFFYGLLAGALALLAGCGGGGGGEEPETTQGIVLHAARGGPPVDVLLDGQTEVPGLAFLSAVTGKLELRDVVLEVRDSVAGIALASGRISPAFGQAAVAILARDAGGYGLIAFNHFFGGSTPTESTLRFVHAAPDAGQVDLFITEPASALPATPTYAALSAYGVRDGFLLLPAGDYRLRITVAGSRSVIYDSGTAPVPGGADVVAVIAPSGGGVSSLSVLLLEPDEPVQELAGF